MRVGLFFGSFDPIHIGHISVITKVLNDGYVDKVIVVPAWHNPFKEHSPAPFMKRWEMCYEATKHIPNVSCTQLEGTLHDRTKKDKIPTWQVLQTYASEIHHSKDIRFIITTSETFNEIPKWEHGEAIIQNTPFIILQNPQCEVNWGLVNKCKYYVNECIVVPQHDIIDISSTKVRALIKQGKIISPYVPNEVQLIIKNNKLYK